MPFNLKKLTERRVELMTQLENMVKNCETETRAFNEEEQTRSVSYTHLTLPTKRIV